MPKIRITEDVRADLSSTMKDTRSKSMHRIGKFIETARSVDGVITVDVSPDVAPTIARLVGRMRWPVRSTILREAGDEVLSVHRATFF